MAAAIRLVAIGSEAVRAYPLVKRKITIGTAADNDIVLEHSSVSRRHAIIVRGLGRFRVRDLDSTNGIRINGRRISGAQRLLPGDELEVGAVRLAVMNGPRRQGGIGAGGVIGLAVALAIAGFGLANYLHLRTSVLPFARSTTVRAPKPAPSAGDGSEPAPPNPASLADGMRAPAEPAAATSVDEEGWLKILNRYRAMAGLAAVRDDAALSAGGFAHARYLVKNSAALIKSNALGAQMHTEDRGAPWYSVEGMRAAQAGDIEQWWGPHPSSRPRFGWAIDEWIGSTWHRMWILNPRLRDVGYGEYCENGACVAVLDVLSRLERDGFTPAAEPAAIEFPPNGAAVQLPSLGDEWPDPLSSCRGFTTPAGLPVTLQLGAMVRARLSAFSIRRGADAQTLEACGFDSSSYVNPSAADQQRARDIMSQLGAVVVIPREPLLPGDYAVEMTVNGHSYRWHFVAGFRP
jgi:uncharacterized protein YkwD